LAFGDSYQGMPIIGTSSTLVTLGGQRNLQQGRSFQSEFEAVAGAGSGMQIGDTFTPLHGQIQQEGAHQHDHIRFTVVGILPKQNNHWDKAILVPIETVWHAHGIDEHEHEQHNDSTGATQAHEPSVSAIVIKSKTIAGAYQIRAQYRSGSTLSVFPAEVLTRLYSTLGDIHYLLALISYGTQALLGVSIMLITIVHLHQRKRQIAALRAFGAPRSAVCALIWLGLIILIFFGLALGAGLGYAVASEIAKHISAQSGFTMPVYFTFNDIKQLFMLLIFASVITLIPALMTYRISPAQALKQ
jgi:putative ABC transport system permease protein